MSNILMQIVADKRNAIASLQQQLPLASFVSQLQASNKDFYRALSRAHNKGNAAFIMECKKASPSKGLIRADFDVAQIAKTYDKYASAISVLTDQQYFQGCHDDLKTVTELVSCPVLNKDFFIDSYQVHLARYYGADAILLMLSVLDDQQYQELAAVAQQYKMAVLTEVSNAQECQRAIALGAKMIGINNRNLRDLSTDISRTMELAPMIPDDRIILSESGIYHNDQVRELAPAVDGFLVGSSLMAQADLDLACRTLLYGNHKVCGLRRIADARAARDAGARFGGLIFVARSPRCIEATDAAELIQAVPELQYVGVFQNHHNDDIARLATELALYAVQLHGDESAADIASLRQLLPEHCQIWKAVAVRDSLPDVALAADLVLLDGKNAGSGEPFSWQLLHDSEQDLSHCMLAGGLMQDNIQSAINIMTGQELFGLDINSGVELAPGIKSKDKLTALFSALRHY